MTDLSHSVQEITLWGLPVFPLARAKKTPIVKWRDAATTSPAPFPEGSNIGIAIPDGLIVVDIDPRNGGSFESLSLLGQVPETLTARTGGGGFHLWFRVPTGTKFPPQIAPGIDVKGLGGYVVAPGSYVSQPPNSAGDGHYTWAHITQVADAPAWLLALAKGGAAVGDEFDKIAAAPLSTGLPRDLTGLCEHLAGAPIGTQSNTATRVATAIANLGGAVERETARAQFVEAGLRMTCSREPWTPETLGAIFDRQCSFAKEKPLDGMHRELTDLGNADRFVAQHAGRVRYCFGRRKWLIWDGSRWVWDDDGAVIRLAADTVRAMLREASESDDSKTVAKWAIASQSHHRIGAMLELAKSSEGIGVRLDELDAQSRLLHCGNGTLDLSTFQLRAHDPRDLMTRSTCLDFDPCAKSELWDRVLDDAVGGDTGLAGFLARFAGLALLGEVLERVFFFLFGPPGTSKSTVIDALAAALGDYHMTADFETWLQRPSHSVGGNRGDLVRLAGTRLVTSTEVEPGRKFDAALIKRVTGGDMITAAAKYEADVSFRPSFVLMLAANDAPHVRDDDDAMWVRMRRVPLTHKVARPDPNVREALKRPEHAQAVLAWAVGGLRAYLRDGLGTCDAVERSNLEYRADMDLFGRFLEEAYELLPGAKVPKRELRESFTRWLRDSGQRYSITDREISRRMEAQGYTSLRSHGVRYWGGIGPVGSWPGLGPQREGVSDAN